MMQTFLYKGIYWNHLQNPTQHELVKLQKAFNLQSATIMELKSPSLKPRTMQYDDYFYLVLHFPEHSHKNGHQNDTEIDFVIGKDYLITVTYADNKSISKLFTQIAEQAKQEQVIPPHSLTPDEKKRNALLMFKNVTDALYKNTESQIDKIRKEMRKIEKNIFRNKQKQMVKAISYVARDIINMNQTLETHLDVWQSLIGNAKDFGGHRYQAIARSAEDNYYKAQTHLNNLWEIMKELRETNNTMLSTQQNEVMKIFTILAFVTFPLSLVASLFGMNTQYTPVLGLPYDFWIIIALMSGATILMFIYFKHKGWI